MDETPTARKSVRSLSVRVSYGTAMLEVTATGTPSEMLALREAILRAVVEVRGTKKKRGCGCGS